jgi:two-component system sensor histidine kinase CpxA
VNLFAKIFLGFWISTAAIIASWLLANQAFTPFEGDIASRWGGETQDARLPGRLPAPGVMDPRGPPGSGVQEFGPSPRDIYRIYYGLQNVAPNDLEGWILRREKEDNIDIRLIDSRGMEIFDRNLLPGSDRVVERLSGLRRRVLHREKDTVFFGQEIYRPEWGALQLIIAAHPPASPVIKFLTEHLWLRLVLAVLISGGISYVVSRYLTRPLKRLQVASRDLAGGNLAARIPVPASGGDETIRLARDFNSMAAQLQEKIQVQKRLLSDVSHELRSPLARMRVALALAEKEPRRSEEQLRRIELETERLDDLIGQLLSSPDTQADMQDSLDMVALLRQVCEDADFEARAAGKGLSMTTSVDDVVLRSHGDLLKKALENVVRNAVHYTRESSTVRVALTDEGNALKVVVEDNGPGVPEDQLTRIFEPFYRIDEARQRETGGFGLGLSIARRAIEKHGGHITACNRGPLDGPESGRGLQVSIHLPKENS